MTTLHTKGKPVEEREDRQGGGVSGLLSGGDERSEPESPTSPSSSCTADNWQAQGLAADAPGGRAAAAPPFLFVTTASKPKPEDEDRPLPGPRKKQADALTENIKWLAETFGKERIGFLTLTLGDRDAGGRYRNLRDRKEAQRRFHSLLTNVIAKRYQCGVIVTERHRNGGLHFHLAVVCATDIGGQMDFNACFPPKDIFGRPAYKPDYATANDAIKREWAFWRRVAKLYGFGRHQLQPMRENGEALGRYLAAYLSADWEHRLPEDKGARCLRYFGHWSSHPRIQGERRKIPPHNSRFGWLTPRARVWRELVKQVVMVLNYKGAKLTEHNIKDGLGAKWAWKLRRLMESVRFEAGEWQDEAVRAGIEAHNLQVQIRWLSGGGDPARCCWWHVTELTLDHLRPSPAWIKQGEELQLAKECESEIRRRLRQLDEKQREAARQREMLREVADLFHAQNVNAGVI
jgi:hypothetical protein